MAFDVSMMAEHKDSNFFLVPQIERVVKETRSETNSTNEKLCESLEQEIIQLKEGFLMQHESKSTTTKLQKIETMREHEKSIERRVWIILTTIFLLIISVPMLMTNQNESQQLQLLEMTDINETNGLTDIAVKSSNGIQQSNELAEIRQQYDGMILKLRSQLIEEATSLVTIKEECISLQKTLDMKLANNEDLNLTIISLETEAKEQTIKSNELIELLKVGAKDEMDRTVFLEHFNQDMKEERVRMTIVQKERDELMANKEFSDKSSFDAQRKGRDQSTSAITVKNYNDIQYANDLSEMKSHHDGQIIKLRSQLKDDTVSMALIKDQYTILQHSVDEMEAAKIVSDHQISFLKNKIESHKKEITEFKDFKTSVEIRQSSLQKTYNNLIHTKKIADARIVTLENQVEKDTKASVHLAERRATADGRLQRLESQLEAASAMIQKQSLTLQKTIERMAEDKKVSESSISKLESQIVSSDERYDMIRSERDNLLSLNSGLNNHITTLHNRTEEKLRKDSVHLQGILEAQKIKDLQIISDLQFLSPKRSGDANEGGESTTEDLQIQVGYLEEKRNSLRMKASQASRDHSTSVSACNMNEDDEHNDDVGERNGVTGKEREVEVTSNEIEDDDFRDRFSDFYSSEDSYGEEEEDEDLLS
eukprot:CAMPEP_0119042048 /NCGR_PEP_ID=MMETSP1177-20130426/14312_1 /TAXON_ID=2985 /ORGANISM="Ochromonas sp, Strain CCMP1899" /LENGTH=651 /DNA_ID=CAMNT_0007008555 /DNA_START=137 /DNA_END=2092 /DNA_ORIENTATION=-